MMADVVPPPANDDSPVTGESCTAIMVPLFNLVPVHRRHLLDISVVYVWPPGAWNCRIVLYANDAAVHTAVDVDASASVLEDAVRAAVVAATRELSGSGLTA